MMLADQVKVDAVDCDPGTLGVTFVAIVFMVERDCSVSEYRS